MKVSILQVFVGSPAEGELHRGDTIAAIENYDASQMTHKQAQDVIKGCGGSCSLRIRRGYVYAIYCVYSMYIYCIDIY